MNAHKHVSHITFYIQQVLVETLNGLGHEMNIILNVYYGRTLNIQANKLGKS
jgi:hypothetical protein